MKINIIKVYKLIEANFKGNTAAFSRELNVSYTTVWRALNSHSTGSAKFLPALSSYCKTHELLITEYLII